MNDLETKFAQTIKKNKSTIYTVCYMFSPSCCHSFI